MSLFPADSIIDWTPGTNVGVIGGIPTDRNTLINVTESPYFAAGNVTETTGTITSGSPTLTVASATDFAVGNYVKVGLPAIYTLSVTAGASGTANITIFVQSFGLNPVTTISVTSGDTATQVATKIRAGTYSGWVTGGSGTDVTFTQPDARTDMAVSFYDSGSTGVTASMTTTQAASIATAGSRIDAIVGTTFTLHDNAASSVTGAIVSHNDQPSIQAAVDGIASGESVYCPAGTYRLDSTITAGTSFSGKSFVGDGQALTIFIGNCNQPFIFGSGSGYYVPAYADRVVVTSGMTEGSTTLVCTGDVSYLSTGSLISVQIENDSTVPVVSVYNFDINTTQAPTNQVVRVVGRSSQTLNIFPPIYKDSSSLESRITTQSFSASNIGVEGFTVNCDMYPYSGGSYSALIMSQCYNSWLKDVKCVNTLNYGTIIASSLLCEMRHCYAGETKGNSTNGSGFLFSGWNCLIEDNIFAEAFPNIEVNAGAAGNVFTYNYGDAMCLTNHSPNNRFNLHEGNAWNYMLSDGYFGTEQFLTVYRSYLWNSAEYGTVSMRRFCRGFNVIGCINGGTALGDNGYPNIGNTFSSGTADYPSDPWRDWGMTGQLTTRTDDTHGQITVSGGGRLAYNVLALHRFYAYWGTNLENYFVGEVTAWSDPVSTFTVVTGTLPALNQVFDSIGPGSFYTSDADGTFQELDLAVAPSVVRKGNYYIGSSTSDSLGPDPLVNSVVYSSKPSNFGTCPWPPYDWTAPLSADIENIPAGYRFVHGNDPPTSGLTVFSGSGSTAFTGSGSVTFA